MDFIPIYGGINHFFWNLVNFSDSQGFIRAVRAVRDTLVGWFSVFSVCDSRIH
jgi:hypothetical protein